MARLNRRAARLATLATAMLVALPLVPATQAAGGGVRPVRHRRDPVRAGRGRDRRCHRRRPRRCRGHDRLQPRSLGRLQARRAAAAARRHARRRRSCTRPPARIRTARARWTSATSPATAASTSSSRCATSASSCSRSCADGTLGAPTLTPSTDSLRVRLGNFDADTALDAVGVGWGTDTATVFTNQGGSLVATPPIAVTHDGWDDLEAADVSGDGRDDIVVMSGQGLVPNIQVLTQLAGGGFAAPVACIRPGRRPHPGHRRRRRHRRRTDRRRRRRTAATGRRPGSRCSRRPPAARSPRP